MHALKVSFLALKQTASQSDLSHGFTRLFFLRHLRLKHMQMSAARILNLYNIDFTHSFMHIDP